jgi:uncharacterized protein
VKDLDNKLLSQINKIVKDRDPSAKIYLYGSRSRGEATSESDWDLLILLNRDNIPLDVEREITYPLYDLDFETGSLI